MADWSHLPEPDDRLSALHVCRAHFVELDLPSGLARLHTGVGTQVVNGVEWRGISDPIGGRIASITGLREPKIGEAAAATIVLIGADSAFLKSVHATRAQIEGRSCKIWWAAFNAETQEMIGEMVPMIPRGYLSSPTIASQGIGQRIVTVTVETMWAAKNFPPGGRWNGAGQRERFPGDLGMNYVGRKIVEIVS